MKVALYKAQAGNWLDTALNVFSGGGGFSHAELVFSDGMSFSSTSRGNGDCTYADGRPKKDGTRWKHIDYDAHPDRWVLVPFGVTAAAEQAMRDFCNGELDARYDFAGCARFVLPFWKAHKTEWFCSEVVIAALQSAGFWRGWEAHKTSPNHLAKLLGVL